MSNREPKREPKKGKFFPTNPGKYKGDLKNIVYRSGWERTVMNYLDTNRNILEWSSEEIVIWYESSVDGRMHRYFPDFWMRALNKDDEVETFILEVKPYAQTIEPKIGKRKTKRLIQEAATWGINTSKWAAAREYCSKRGWKFRLITENELGKQWLKKK